MENCGSISASIYYNQGCPFQVPLAVSVREWAAGGLLLAAEAIDKNPLACCLLLYRINPEGKAGELEFCTQFSPAA